jgi:protein-L-isoaspartate(D-aspartate) O-methyltransferase
MKDFASSRKLMVDQQLRARGLSDPRVLAAMAKVPREAFLPAALAEFAYEDRPLPIAAGQTISQPYIVALMTEALGLRADEEVLEIGTGSGYAAAVLSHVARRVYTVERHALLADSARDRLAALGYDNVEVSCGDGSLGWSARAPFDGIAVAAGGPDLPQTLLDQLSIGGRLIMPIGPSRTQRLVRVIRESEHDFRREDLGPVMFVPLIGEHGWTEGGEVPAVRGTLPPRPRASRGSARPTASPTLISKLIAECAEPFDSLDDVALDALLDRIGEARVVLLGEATHGTSEFYRMRTRITQALISRRGFTAVAVEADWPDATEVDRYVRALPPRSRPWVPFARFPTWMWRNREVQALLEWLRAHNEKTPAPERKTSFSGLDMYSMYTSAYQVVRYLDRVDPVAAKAARERYGRLTPWQSDPAAYGRAVLVGRMRSCEDEVIAMLRELLARRVDASMRDDGELFDAAQNARVVAGAERYYRALYYGSAESWNLRDQHMFDTMRSIREHRGENTKMVVWEHNSHVGDAGATEMAARGEHNVGHLCRAAFGEDVYLVGFGTHHGTVAAAHAWDDPMRRMRVRPAHPDSYERLCHDAAVPAFMMALRTPVRAELGVELAEPRLERAIGVVYRPETELASHYFQAVLPAQFDEYIWFDETSSIEPLGASAPSGHPFSLREASAS